MGKPELLVKIHEDKIFLDGLDEFGLGNRNDLPEGHTLLVPLLPHGVTDYLESVGFSHGDALLLTAAVQQRKESNASFLASLRAMPTVDPEMEEAFRKDQAERANAPCICTVRARMVDHDRVSTP